MVVDKIFKENMLIEVYDEESKVYYKSLIQEVDDTAFAIGVPMKGKSQLIMREKNDYNMRVTVGDALYSFNSEVIGRKRSGNVLLFVLAWPEEIKRSQRRQFFRLAASLEADYWVLRKGGSAADGEEKDGAGAEDPDPDLLRQLLPKLLEQLPVPSSGIIVDISGGGIALVVNRFIPEGSLLALRFQLNSKNSRKEFLLKGQVVRVFDLEATKEVRRYRLGLEFVEISEKVRDELINIIFILSREKAR